MPHGRSVPISRQSGSVSAAPSQPSGFADIGCQSS
jgi:hypothetical protein